MCSCSKGTGSRSITISTRREGWMYQANTKSREQKERGKLEGARAAAGGARGGNALLAVETGI